MQQTGEGRIAIDADVLGGKPVVRGTRLAVEFIIGLLADGWSEPDILSNYPGLTHDDLAACLAYARDVLSTERVVPTAAQPVHFLADENFPGAAVEALGKMGHDVEWVRLIAPGISDNEVLVLAASEGRVVLTFDKDFGERARAANLPTSCGVVLFRLPMPQARDAARLADAIGARSDWAGHFSVVEPGRIRMRVLQETLLGTLYYGDNLEILREHVKDETVDLVYLDPPFNSNASYNVLFRAPDGHESHAQMEAFEDTWHWDAPAERAFDEVMQSGNADAAEILTARS